MKGFGIEIKNNLLDPKHIEHMGIAVWLYMWLIDKMTSISEDGVGLVLGGKPIKFEDARTDLGVSERTYNRWLSILKTGGYVNIKRTPYGLVLSVNKAFKRFGKTVDNIKRDTPHVADLKTKVADLSDKSGGSNKTITEDNNSKTIGPSKKIIDLTSLETDHFIDSLVKEHNLPRVLTIEEIRAFISYWTETDQRGKERWRKERVFDFNRRLATWFRNKHAYMKDFKCRHGIWHRRDETCLCGQKQSQEAKEKEYMADITPEQRARNTAKLGELRKELSAKMIIK